MTEKGGLLVVAFVNYDLPETGACIQSWKGARFSEQIDVLVHVGKRINVSDGYGI